MGVIAARRSSIVVLVSALMAGCGGGSVPSAPSTVSTSSATSAAPSPSPTPAAPAPTPQADIAPMTGISITNVTPNPSVAGQIARVSAVGSGGVAPYQFKYVDRGSGGTIYTLRDWSTDSTYEVQITSAGSFTSEVWGRSAGVTADAPQVSTTFTLKATDPPPGGTVTGVTGTVEEGLSPRPVGQPITFIAYPIGGVKPYQTKWFVNKNLAQDWATTTTFKWTPTAPGSYTIDTWVRSAGATADVAEASMSSVPFQIVASSLPFMTGITFGTLSVHRTATGAQISVPFTGQGGAPPYQFRVTYSNRTTGAFQVVHDWSSVSGISYTVTQPGDQSFTVQGRSAQSTTGLVEAETGYGLYLDTVVAAPPASVTVTASPPGPARVGTFIQLNATATGSAPTYAFQYEFQLNGGAPTSNGAWGSPGTHSWTPTAAGTYTVTVHAKQFPYADDLPQATSSMTYVITP